MGDVGPWCWSPMLWMYQKATPKRIPACLQTLLWDAIYNIWLSCLSILLKGNKSNNVYCFSRWLVSVNSFEAIPNYMLSIFYFRLEDFHVGFLLWINGNSFWQGRSVRAGLGNVENLGKARVQEFYWNATKSQQQKLFKMRFSCRHLYLTSFSIHL